MSSAKPHNRTIGRNPTSWFCIAKHWLQPLPDVVQQSIQWSPESKASKIESWGPRKPFHYRIFGPGTGSKPPRIKKAGHLPKVELTITNLRPWHLCETHGAQGGTRIWPTILLGSFMRVLRWGLLVNCLDLPPLPTTGVSLLYHYHGWLFVSTLIDADRRCVRCICFMEYWMILDDKPFKNHARYLMFLILMIDVVGSYHFMPNHISAHHVIHHIVAHQIISFQFTSLIRPDNISELCGTSYHMTNRITHHHIIITWAGMISWAMPYAWHVINVTTCQRFKLLLVARKLHPKSGIIQAPIYQVYPRIAVIFGCTLTHEQRVVGVCCFFTHTSGHVWHLFRKFEENLDSSVAWYNYCENI